VNSRTGNLGAFLDTIAWSEIGPQLLAVSDNGYNVCVGSTPAHPILFQDYSRHPGHEEKHYPDGPGISRNEAMDSDAAGRYQFMGRYWPHYRKQLRLPDFGHESQDTWCVQLIRECRALDDVIAGRLFLAVSKCRSRWASFPGAGYKQRENQFSDLETAYLAAGGTLD